MTMPQLCTSRRLLRRAALLSTALCALVLAGCADQPGETVEVAGRQAAGATPPGATEAAVLKVAAQVRAAGDLGSAIGFYRRAHEMNPSDAQALVELGDTLNLAGAPNEAVDAYRKALELYPDHPEALRGLGVTMVALNQPASAVDVLQHSLKLAPDPRTYDGLAVAKDLLGDHKAAEDAYHDGLTLAPGDLNLRNNLGLSQAIAGQYDAAVETLRGVATDPAAGARHRLNLALALGLAGRTDEAARVARIDLDDRSVRSNLAYYAELRGLSPIARAQAIFRPDATPNIASRTQGPAASCDTPPCGTAQPEKQSAVPADSKPAVEKKIAAAPAPAEKSTAMAAAPKSPPATAAASTTVGGPAPDATALAAALAALDGGDQGGQWVQLAAMPDAKRAERAWQDMAQRAGDVLHDMGHQVQRADLGPDKGVLFRLRAGPIDTVESARSLCSALERRGIACFVVRS